MRKSIYTLLLFVSGFYIVNAQMTINYVSTPPTIDGDFSDWGTTWINMDSTIGTTSGASCKFQVKYDNDNLYFIFDAKDGDMFDTSYSATWNSDCIEICMTMTSADTLMSTSGMYQFRRMTGDASHSNGLTDGTTWGTDISISRWEVMPQMKVVESDAADGYVMEWQIPWDSLIVALPDPVNGVGPFDRKHFRLEVQQSDRTVLYTYRTQENFWYGTSNNAWNYSGAQGLITLADSLQLPKPHLTIYRTATPPTIDGDTSDWGTDWIDMTQAPITNTTTGMTAKFQSKFDYNNLYMIFSVTDDTPGDTSVAVGTWLRDNVNVMLSMDTTSSNGITGMYMLRRVYGWDAGTGAPGGDSGLTDGIPYGKGVSINDLNASPNFKIKEAIDGDTYIQEWQIPWDSLKVRMAPSWDTKQFKLEVEAVDNTGGITRTQLLHWYGNTEYAWNNSAYQGVVTLDYNIPIPPKRKLTINKTATPPTIDGNASDWGTSWINMDSTIGTTSGASCKFQVKYDENNLYFIFDAKDADMFDTISSQIWNSDEIEIALSMSTDSLYESSGMYVFRRMVGWNNGHGLSDGTTFGQDIPISRWLTNTDLKIEETDSGDGYVMEWQIPWDSLIVALPDIPNNISAFDEQHFRLEVLQSDRTFAAGFRTQGNFWYGTSNKEWNNSAYQGLVTLADGLQPRVQMILKHVSPPPTIDGDASDWGTTWIKMDKTIGTTSGASCKFQAEYDNRNLYFIFDAKDDDMYDTIYSASWNSDNIEVLLTMYADSPLIQTSGMYQFRRMVGDASHSNGLTDGTTWGNDISIDQWKMMHELKIKEIDNSVGYVMEWQIPWDNLIVALPDIDNGIPAFDNKYFKLEVQQADRTLSAGYRSQQNFWYGTSNNAWNNSEYQGLVSLEATLVVDTSSRPDNINNIVSANLLNIYVVNDHLVLSRPVSEISVYNIAGQLLLKANNTSSININRLKQGLYIARTEDVSYKFIRK